MLNALRHQRSFHTAHCWLSCVLQFVLNALRHQRSFHHWRVSPDFPDVFVLNALRHQRSFHRRSDGKANEKKKCSTPCGIKDRFTDFLHERSKIERSAQRLAASKIVSQRGGEEYTEWVKCSTPCGIKDRFTTGRSAMSTFAD